MLERGESLSLKNYNTFGIDCSAQEVLLLEHTDQLKEIKNLNEVFILGGGSNVLFTADLNKRVLINQSKGITEIQKGDEVALHIASGEVWHDVVEYAVSKNYGGIENLSLIPGSVGAAPMQNIGAYGVEIKDVLEYVDVIDLKSLEKKRFTKEECEFAYRESVFKKKFKGKYFIAAIGIILTTNNHELNTSYGAIQDELDQLGIVDPSVRDVSEAVIRIRKSKLPDPQDLGNAGSFFKNPVIDIAHFNALKEKFPNIKNYPVSESKTKVPAGWLIESLGWKGKRIGNTGSHEKQALVLVNYGSATGSEVKELSDQIRKSVMEKYMIRLETEVNIIS
ncbi:MAG: UDP-N-acetylmuramate dehydrogenase [Bacteroidia bacterium]